MAKSVIIPYSIDNYLVVLGEEEVVGAAEDFIEVSFAGPAREWALGATGAAINQKSDVIARTGNAILRMMESTEYTVKLCKKYEENYKQMYAEDGIGINYIALSIINRKTGVEECKARLSSEFPAPNYKRSATHGPVEFPFLAHEIHITR